MDLMIMDCSHMLLVKYSVSFDEALMNEEIWWDKYYISELSFQVSTFQEKKTAIS